MHVHLVAGRQFTCHAEIAIPVAASPEETGECGTHENSSQPDSEASPSASVYDDIGNVIADEDEDTAAGSQQNAYDGLQESTRDVVTQEPSVYEKIRPDTAAAATGSEVTTHQDKHTVSVQTVDDDGMNVPRLSTASTRSAPVSR